MDWQLKIGARLRSARKLRRETLREAGAAAHVNYTDISKLERGLLPHATVKMVVKLAQHYQIDVMLHEQ